MQTADEKICTGCICKSCKKSEINGALFVCNSCGCSACSEDSGYCKLSTCTEHIPYGTGYADDLRL